MVQAVTRIRCPLCNDELGGLDKEELNSLLKNHLMVNHGMKNLRVAESAGADRTEVAPTIDAPRLGSRSPSDRPAMVGGQEGEEQTPTQIAEDTVEPREGDQESEAPRGNDVLRIELTDEKGWSYIGNYKPLLETVDCPLCGQRVEANTEEDLSVELKDHFRNIHRIKPTIRARLRVRSKN
jgi:predicted small metal-binding protein